MSADRRHPSGSLFVVWEGYQRRTELLAPLLEADTLFLPSRFRSKWLRPLDYLYKLFATLRHIRLVRPAHVVVQAPPHVAALPSMLLGVPFTVDAHNGMFQSYWRRLPLATRVLERARLVLVHNDEILDRYASEYPGSAFQVVGDPLSPIRFTGLTRRRDRILFVCSFDLDEPVDAIITVIEQVPDHEFVITADPQRLPAHQRRRLLACGNVRLTGFLSVEDYQRELCSSAAAIALTDKEATQQSGACEALSSNTPLIATRSSLTRQLFGAWAILVENSAESIIDGIRMLRHEPLDLEPYLTSWNARVLREIASVKTAISDQQRRP